MKITVAGVGYVGLSLAVLLAQKHEVTAITTMPAKAEKLNRFISPIQDEEIEWFFAEARDGSRKLNLTTTVDKDAAYSSADLVIIATPTNYDDEHHFFDTSAVEDAIEHVLRVNPNVLMVIKSTVPVGYTDSVRRKYASTTSFSARSFCGNPRRCMTTCTPAALWSAHMTTKRLRRRCSPDCFRRERRTRMCPC